MRVLPSQNPPDSTPPADNPVTAASPVARIIAVSGSSQPRTGDQRIPAGSPSARCWGSNTATVPRRCRARRVAVRLSGRVEVVTTGPGASRMAGMTMCRPLPERGGPISRIESSTLAHTPCPFDVPSRYPTSPGFGSFSDGRNVDARFRRVLSEATWAPRAASPCPPTDADPPPEHENGAARRPIPSPRVRPARPEPRPS